MGLPDALADSVDVLLTDIDDVTGVVEVADGLEVAVVDEGSDGVQLRVGLGLGLLDSDADAEAERADTLLAEDGDAAAAVCVSLLVVLTVSDAVTDGEPDGVPLAEMLPDCDVDGAADRDGDVLGLPLPLPLGDVVPVSDGDGDAEAHTLDPAMLEVPDGHTAWVDDVDPGPQ